MRYLAVSRFVGLKLSQIVVTLVNRLCFIVRDNTIEIESDP